MMVVVELATIALIPNFSTLRQPHPWASSVEFVSCLYNRGSNSTSQGRLPGLHFRAQSVKVKFCKTGQKNLHDLIVKISSSLYCVNLNMSSLPCLSSLALMRSITPLTQGVCSQGLGLDNQSNFPIVTQCYISLVLEELHSSAHFIIASPHSSSPPSRGVWEC